MHRRSQPRIVERSDGEQHAHEREEHCAVPHRERRLVDWEPIEPHGALRSQRDDTFVRTGGDEFSARRAWHKGARSNRTVPPAGSQVKMPEVPFALGNGIV